MRIELICIGNELLSGRTLNSNATEIAQKLEKAGLSLAAVTTVRDREEDVSLALEQTLERADIVITTGGLGPTSDDCTRSILAKFFKTSFAFNEEVAQDLRARFGTRECSLENQATIPEAAQPIINPVGTAPGLLFQQNGKKIYVLPGVPQEMRALLEKKVLPDLSIYSAKKSSHEMHLMLASESQIAPYIESLEKKYPALFFGSYPELGSLTLRLAGPECDIRAAARELNAHFAKILFEESSASMALQQAMIARGKTLAVAESCTGGALSARLTVNSGSSGYFLGGVIAYSNALKGSLLGVKEETLATEGAVSAPVVEEMAEGLLKSTGADIAIAVSGVAGPTGGTLEKPVGTVWFSVLEKGHPPMSGLIPCQHKKTRTSLIETCVSYLVGNLWKWVVHQEKVGQ